MNTYSVILSVPISNHNSDIAIWGVERNRNNISVINNDATETPWRPLEIEGGEVEEAPNLVLNLKIVSPVPLGRDGTICAQDPILPWTPPLLYTRPESHSKQAQTFIISISTRTSFFPDQFLSKSSQAVLPME